MASLIRTVLVFVLEEPTGVLPHTETRQMNVRTLQQNSENVYLKSSVTWVRSYSSWI